MIVSVVGLSVAGCVSWRLYQWEVVPVRGCSGRLCHWEIESGGG